MGKRAYIHHKDGNSINNPQDGSNWETLCSKCHTKKPKSKGSKDGIILVTLFTPWKRAEILRDRGYCCGSCGADLSLTRSSNKPRPRCITCGRIIDRKQDEILWKDGSIMCIECFERNY